ncbi:TetR/AcrR family transcriptional regulator [Tistrella mobilis]|uniref:Transcriptional regulator, TetR family n=1 Tax=Tistrella mobilis (strain KA081020-065) TaxID=1110502 RepID=I3TI61_TISMK|nr:TetR/AcrR family transcriptional regulator [Tistrella mobilis]AFK52449.1 transcriptional regulator, TetR family [Tistrella mobilis KA081020-065]
MKVTREQAAANRAAIVKAAGRLFRERGFDGVGVAEIMKAAGLTHGGFYGHFASKDALAAEACGKAFGDTIERLETGRDQAGRDLGRYVENYLSEAHRTRRDIGCPIAALATEVPRQDAGIQASYAEGIDRFIDTLAARFPALAASEGDRGRAILVISALVGGLALARATEASDRALSDEILAAVRDEITKLPAT